MRARRTARLPVCIPSHATGEIRPDRRKQSGTAAGRSLICSRHRHLGGMRASPMSTSFPPPAGLRAAGPGQECRERSAIRPGGSLDVESVARFLAAEPPGRSGRAQPGQWDYQPDPIRSWDLFLPKARGPTPRAVCEASIPINGTDAVSHSGLPRRLTQAGGRVGPDGMIRSRDFMAPRCRRARAFSRSAAETQLRNPNPPSGQSS